MKVRVTLQWLLASSVYAAQVHPSVRLVRAAALSYTNTSGHLATYSPTDNTEVPKSIFSVISATQGCLANSTVTYIESVYPTVFITVESSYEVTVTASNVSVTDAPTIFETPATPCVTTIFPLNHNGSSPAFQETGSPLPPAGLSSGASKSRSASHMTPNVFSAGPGESTYTIPTDGFRRTSTVVVTKKTPVPVVQVPQSTNPPVTFVQLPSTQPLQTTGNSPVLSSAPTPGPDNDDGNRVSGSRYGNGSNTNNNGNGNDDNNNNPNDINDNGGNHANEASSSLGAGGSNVPAATSQGSHSSTTPAPLAGAEAGISKLGQIMDSIINSPSAALSPAPASAALTSAPAVQPTVIPTTVIIAGIAVTINTSNIVIGSSTIAIPTAAQAQATVQIASQVFTILPSQIIAPSTTYNFIPTSANNLIAEATSSITTQSPSVVTANGIVLTIGATQAVLSGTTYQIGTGASSTHTVINGQSISIGSNGVAFPSTTFAPAITLANNKYEVVTADGLTLSIDVSEALIGGRTYSIGSGAVATTVVIGSRTIALGSGGVVLASTTVHPTSGSMVATTTKSISTSGSNDGDISAHSIASSVIMGTSTSTSTSTSARSSATGGARSNASTLEVRPCTVGILAVILGFLPTIQILM